ncbi:MAG: hypothetical protein MUQ00_17630 [Candidatus Aminicenantes bacterium]|nr:hypothetical protein [Candidatus Aminicenantes bacterium]
MNRKWITIGCIVLVGAALLSAPLLAADDKPKKGPAKVVWDQPFAKAAIAPGGTAALNAVFTANKDLTEVGFAVSPSIKNVLTVTPTGLPSVAAGTPVPITLTVLIPADPECRNFNGNLWVTVRGKKINKPLHLRFKVKRAD